ncbi:LPS export ABC transporter periplasmic protein LptC [Sporomusa sp.]|uniref:LPS export ABC transporter periplasmic protein LptC n=1 Tax=Sporomusa sp. TaxID=2078658 RepID=UPI002BE48A6C|nr:LPS export ABC transporter periplasmic protein LptC [Sporomusa sp.]HWR05919.1 LPS export ABC transporter periplasmic protein LptC [Sporomusa sp.]
MIKKNYLGIACVVLILAGGLYYLFGGEPGRDSATDPQAAPTQAATNLTFAGSSIIEEQDGKRLWELSADTIEAEPTGKVVYLNNLKGVFYQENGDKMEIIAKRAVLDAKTHDISMQGDIKATASDGAVFTAPEARWSGEPKNFTGTGGVTLIRNGTIITGDNILTDANMEKVKVYGRARVITGGKTE